VSQRYRTQAGQALLEWLLVATLALLLVIWGSDKWMARAEQAAFESMGQWLLTLSHAMQTALDSRPESGSIPILMTQHPPATTDQWLRGLKQAGFLVSAFPERAPLPYQIQVHRVVAPCQAASCPQVWLLLALPPAHWDDARREGAAPDLMVALQGKGLVVSGLNPRRLQGASFAIDAQWPVGTVGVLAWRSDVLPPFVRLHESRPVHLAGGLSVQGGLNVTGKVSMSDGLMLGAGATLSGPCAPDGLLLRSPDHHLLMCRGGQWQSWQPKPNDWQACLPRPAENLFLTYVRHNTVMEPFMPGLDINQCRCTPGYIPRWVGSNIPAVAGVGVTDGFLCEKS
jgi:hypothetical protein